MNQVVKTYIQKHSHLPGLPSQDSVLKNGQGVGELQKLQQKKLKNSRYIALYKTKN